MPTPRAVAGGASVDPNRSLASFVVLKGTGLFGSDCQTAASCAEHRLTPIYGESDP